MRDGQAGLGHPPCRVVPGWPGGTERPCLGEFRNVGVPDRCYKRYIGVNTRDLGFGVCKTGCSFSYEPVLRSPT